MVVGQDVPFLADDEAGANPLLSPLGSIVPEASEGAEELPEGIPVSEGVSSEPFKSGILHLFAYLNVDHARPHLFGQVAEIARRSTSSRPRFRSCLKKAAGIEKGSGVPNREKVGKVTNGQVREIAEIKFKDMNSNDIESAMKQIEGTARNMGLTVVD